MKQHLGTTGKTPYPSKFIIIDGATANERPAKKRAQSLYVYAARFVDPSNLPWSKSGTTTTSIEKSAFGKTAYQLGLEIKYFPQRTH